MTRDPVQYDQPRCFRSNCDELVRRKKDDTGWLKYCSDRCKRSVLKRDCRARKRAARRGEGATKKAPEVYVRGMGQLEAGARELGFSWEPFKKIVERLIGIGEIPAAPEVVTSEWIAEILEKVAARILLSISDLDILRATPMEKVRMASALLDKRQLLRGEPTKIVSYAERSERHDSLKELLAEAAKRGMIIDGTFKEVPNG